MHCEFCGKEESLPFVCNYCGGVFCGDHRLPEAHKCRGDLTQRRTIVAPTTTTFSWQTPSASPSHPAVSKSNVFSRIEVRDILIAWLGIGFAVGVAFSGVLSSRFSLSYLGMFWGIALITIGPGFILHELSHKFAARRYGFWAEFRMWPQMLLMAIFMAVIGFFFAAPGATYISGTSINKEENGIISFAGPLTNLAIAAMFVPVYLAGGVSSIFGFIGGFGLTVNLELAAFNLLPLGPLDGTKVFHWNKLYWAVALAVSGAAALFAYFQILLPFFTP